MVRVDGFTEVMNPFKIAKISQHVIVDKKLLNDLVRLGVQKDGAVDDDLLVDEVRGLLKLSMEIGYDIDNLLDYYNAFVVELAKEILNEHIDEITDLLEESIYRDIGVREELEEGIEEIEEELEKVIPEEPKEEMFIPEKIKKRYKGVEYETYKPQKWRERKQKYMSKQEMFIYSRRESSIKDIQSEYQQKFKIYRSEKSIKTKLYRLRKHQQSRIS